MTVDHIPLHQHSGSSLLDGYSTSEEYIERAKEIGIRGLGITDHGTTSGVYQFITAAREAGLIPVPGCEMYVAPVNPLGARVSSPVFYGKGGRKSAQYDVSGNGAFLHLTVLAVNNIGLKNLFALSTASYQPEHYYAKPRIDFDMLEKYSEGLVILTGCPSSEISTRFLLGQDKKAYEHASRLKEIFTEENLFVEVMEHNMSNDIERLLLPKQQKLAKDLGLKLVATNDCHYAHKHNALAHEEMLCSQSGSVMSEPPFDQGGKRFAFDGSEFYLKSGAEMLELFPESEFPGAVTNSVLIAEMAQSLKLDYNDHLKPNPEVPKGYDQISYLKALINDGYKVRYGNASDDVKAEAKKRIAEEFEVIYSSDFVGYFLVVYEYIKWTRDNFSTLGPKGEILALPHGPGRGSVGGSIIAYLLFISELCPIKHDLLFERFLSAGRGSTYKITYTDGTTEEIVVSDKKLVSGDGGIEERYIHQLSVGDCVTDPTS
jgi:DNA polymerase-3 subunit alpha